LSSDAASIVCLTVSMERQDGGGQRLSGFRRALADSGVAVEIVNIGPRSTDAEHSFSAGLVHRTKRRLLPMPLRRRIEGELASVKRTSSPTICLVPSANRWALRSRPTWLDYSDLWSQYARNHAATVGPIAGLSSRMQSQLWARREGIEATVADVVTVASWSDQQKMGSRAVWLPHPVVNAPHFRTLRRPTRQYQSGITYGLIANFDYPPNRDAYDRLIRGWLPVLRLGSGRVLVAGFGSERLPKAAGVEVLGPVDTVAGFYDDIDVALAPLERGGGMKVKVVEAMMHGVPVVATDHSKDGLPDAVTAECLDFESLHVNIETLADRIRDPRLNVETAAALNSFTYESFNETVNRLWRDRMTPD